MKLTSLTPNLMVKNVDETITFYRDTLGFTVTMKMPEQGPATWAYINHGTVALMFQEEQSITQEYPQLAGSICAGFTLYLETDNVDAVYDHLKDKVTVVKEPHITFYGKKELAIQDNNGIILVFAQAA